MKVKWSPKLLGAVIVLVILTAATIIVTYKKYGRRSALATPAPVVVQNTNSAAAANSLPPALLNLPKTECQIDSATGIRCKTVIKREGIRASATPGGVEDGELLRYFMPYFIFEQVKIGNLEYYQIGKTPRKASIIGWVSEDNAHPWMTRIMDNFIERMPTLEVYKTKEDLIAKLSGGNSKPIAVSAQNYEHKDTIMGLPVVKREYFKHNNKTYELHQLIFLGETGSIRSAPANNGSAPSVPALPITEEQRQQLAVKVSAGVRCLDVVFVIDTTDSMQPWIDQVKKVVKILVEAIAKLTVPNQPGFKSDVAFGLVEYRDYVDGLHFPQNNNKVYRAYPLTTNLNNFRSTVDAIVDADITSVDWPEAMTDGVYAGLTEMNWRAAGLSERIIILVGDNSGHLPNSPRNPKNINLEQLTNIATQKGRHVTIYSLCANNRGPEVEKNLHREQFTKLAKGTGGECYPLSEYSRVIPLVQTLFSQGVGTTVERFKTVIAIAHGDINVEEVKRRERERQRVSGSQDVDIHKVVKVLVFLENAGIDVSQLAPGQTMFSTGWVCTQKEGVEILEKEVYMSKADVNFLLSNLNQIAGELREPGAAIKLFGGVLGVRTEGLFLLDQSNWPADIFLAAQGVAVSEHSMLNFSRAEIEHMSPDKRLETALKLEKYYVPSLTNERNEDNRFPGLDELMHGRIREKSLP